MKDAIILPGTRTKRARIDTIVDTFFNSDSNYLAYTAKLHTRLNYDNQKLLAVMKRNPYLLHWAAGHPYQETIDRDDLTITTAERIEMVQWIVKTLKSVPSANMESLLRFRNYWGESVLHVAVASQNMSDSDTLLLLKEWLAAIPKAKQAHALQQLNNGNASVLDYAKLLNKSATVQFISNIISLELSTLNIPTNKRVQEYFKQVGIELSSFAFDVAIDPLDSLQQLYKAHMQTFPFQNFELREMAAKHPSTRTRLNLHSFWNLTAGNEHGGYCFQSTLLFYYILIQFNYQVDRHLARVLNGMEVNAKDTMALPATHLVLSVTIADEVYFLDPGLASRAPRQAMNINNTNEVQQDYELVKLSKIVSDSGDPTYVFSKKIGDKFSEIIQTDLVPVTEQEVQFAMTKLTYYPNTIGIRDNKLAVSIVTKTGNQSLLFDAKINSFVFTEEKLGRFTKEILKDSISATQILMTKFNITHISANQLQRFTQGQSPLVVPPMENTRTSSLSFSL